MDAQAMKISTFLKFIGGADGGVDRGGGRTNGCTGYEDFYFGTLPPTAFSMLLCPLFGYFLMVEKFALFVMRLINKKHLKFKPIL